jgi:hypothetical protein
METSLIIVTKRPAFRRGLLFIVVYFLIEDTCHISREVIVGVHGGFEGDGAVTCTCDITMPVLTSRALGRMSAACF